MAVKLIEDQALWDRFVEESPDGSVFHRWKMLRIVEKHSGYLLLPYGVCRSDELIALFPVFYKKNVVFGSVFAPPPQSCVPYLGPVMSAASRRAKSSTRESYLQTAVDVVDAEIRKLSPSYVRFQLPPGQFDIRPFKWHRYVEETNFTYFLDIDRPLEQILGSFDRNARRFIRDAEGLGLEVRRSYDVDTFCRIMRDRYAEMKLTFPILGERYLEEMLEAFPENLRMYFLYRGDEIVSLIVVIIYRGRMTYWMGNAKTGSDLAGNEYLIWELIKKAREEGCSEFEIQGAGDQRLWRFKSKFNPRLEVCYALCQKDRRGQVAEWAYRHIKRKVRA
ncbi:MAG: lipid II:glycine glycyltransferase FemX [Betaproteobacteria bacterium]